MVLYYIKFMIFLYYNAKAIRPLIFGNQKGNGLKNYRSVSYFKQIFYHFQY